MSLLWQARFFTTVNHLRDLPNTQVPEIAFAGRSNAGKSSAINVLTNQKGLAFASKTPGRTQHINYFSIGGAYPLTTNITIDGAYMNIQTPGRRGRTDERPSRTISATQLNNGVYSLGAHILSLSLKASF